MVTKRVKSDETPTCEQFEQFPIEAYKTFYDLNTSCVPINDILGSMVSSSTPDANILAILQKLPAFRRDFVGMRSAVQSVTDST